MRLTVNKCFNTNNIKVSKEQNADKPSTLNQLTAKRRKLNREKSVKFKNSHNLVKWNNEEVKHPRKQKKLGADIGTWLRGLPAN